MDERLPEDRYRLEPTDNLNLEAMFERRWALPVLEAARVRLRNEYVRVGKAEHYERVKVFEAHDGDVPSYAEVAALLGITASAAKWAVHRLRTR